MVPRGVLPLSVERWLLHSMGEQGDVEVGWQRRQCKWAMFSCWPVRTTGDRDQVWLDVEAFGNGSGGME